MPNWKTRNAALWLLWAACALLTVVLSRHLYSSQLAQQRSLQHALMTTHLERIAQGYQDLLALQEELVKHSELEQAVIQKQAEPFCRVYSFGPDFLPIQGSRPLPAWISEKLKSRPSRWLRSLPLGAAAVDTLEPSSPYCIRLEKGRVVELDLDYVHNTWWYRHLPAGLERNDVECSWAFDQRTLAPQPDDEGDMIWQHPSLWKGHALAFPYRHITLRLEPTRARVLRAQLPLWVVSATTLLAFGASLAAAARAMRQAEEQVRARQLFNAMVAHELRTPVTALRMYQEILEHQLAESPEKVAEYQQLCGQQSLRLQVLVENLLRLGQLQSGQSQWKPQEIELGSWCQRYTSQAKVEVQSDLEPLWSDPEGLEMSLDNLLENARRYAQESELQVRQVGRQICLEVLDRGSGIPVEQRQLVLEPYRRLQSGGRGTGLGLAIVAAWVKAAGGHIEVLGRPGGGSIFRILLPIGRGNEHSRGNSSL